MQIAPVPAHVALVRAPVLLVLMEVGHVRAPILTIVVQIAEVSPAILEIRAQAAPCLPEVLARGLDRVGVAGLVGVAQLLARAAERGAILLDALRVLADVLLVTPDVRVSCRMSCRSPGCRGCLADAAVLA